MTKEEIDSEHRIDALTSVLSETIRRHVAQDGNAVTVKEVVLTLLNLARRWAGRS